MDHVHVLDHPLLQHKLSILRDKNTGVKDFRQIRFGNRHTDVL
jgi:uracil phosphoribosyltransferase